MWLDRVSKAYGGGLDVSWKSFQLEQVNSKEGPEWKVWEQPNADRARSLVAARAGIAASRQGRDALNSFHLALLVARHGGEGRISLNEEEPITEVAAKSGLDVGQLKEDMRDPSLLNEIARDHTEAVESHGVFGTPTFVFENGNSAYLKTFVPPEQDSVAFFEHFVALVSDRPYLGELKRPQPPWPKGPSDIRTACHGPTGFPRAASGRLVPKLRPTARGSSAQLLRQREPGELSGSNERLEFLGDALIGLVIADHLYRRFPDQAEGELTMMRSLLVRGETLARIANSLDLGQYLLMGRGEEAGGGRDRASNQAAAFEALVGALLLDQGYDLAQTFVLRVMSEELAAVAKGRLAGNAKSLLQELVQIEGAPAPSYRVVEVAGEDHEREFTAEVVVSGTVMGRGTGRRKSLAEQQAARKALEALGHDV